MDLIDSFSTTMQAIIVVLVFSGLTVAGLYFVRRHVSSRQLKEDQMLRASPSVSSAPFMA
jgi:hypothetical protein